MRRSQIARDSSLRRSIDEMIIQGQSLEQMAKTFRSHGISHGSVRRYVKRYQHLYQHLGSARAIVLQRSGDREGLNALRARQYAQAAANLIGTRDIDWIEAKIRSEISSAQFTGASENTIDLVRRAILGIDE